MNKIKPKYDKVKFQLNERSRRKWAAEEAIAFGYGGISAVSRATGISRPTIIAGIKEVKTGYDNTSAMDRIRKNGGGRKKLEDKDEQLIKELTVLISTGLPDPHELSLLWVSKSTRELARILTANGFPVSHVKVSALLKQLGFKFRGKTNRWRDNRHRNAQFYHINKMTLEFMSASYPVVYLTVYKRRNLRETDETNVGINDDNAQFAISMLRNWWSEMGKDLYLNAEQLLIHVDSGSCPELNNKSWETKLGKFAYESKLDISVCHLPPGATKWRKIEHKMFSLLSKVSNGQAGTYKFCIELIEPLTPRSIPLCPELAKHSRFMRAEDIDEMDFERYIDYRDKWNYKIVADNCYKPRYIEDLESSTNQTGLEKMILNFENEAILKEKN
jgi:DDE family transposase